MTKETCDHHDILKKGISLEECLVAHLDGEGPCVKCPSCGKWVDGKNRRRIGKESIMDVKELSNAKKELGVRLCKEINDFELKTRMEVVGIRIIRKDTNESCPMIEYVNVEVRVPD